MVADGDGEPGFEGVADELAPDDCVPAFVSVACALTLSDDVPRFVGVGGALAMGDGEPPLVAVPSAVAAEVAVTVCADDAVTLGLGDTSGDRDSLSDADGDAVELREGAPVRVCGGDAVVLGLGVEKSEPVIEAEGRGLFDADGVTDAVALVRGEFVALVERRGDALKDAHPLELRDARRLAESTCVADPE